MLPLRLLARDLDPLEYRHLATFGFKKIIPILCARFTLAFLMNELFETKLYVISDLSVWSNISFTLDNRSLRCPVLKISTKVWRIPEHAVNFALSLQSAAN
jgi:hypothetical protein